MCAWSLSDLLHVEVAVMKLVLCIMLFLKYWVKLVLCPNLVSEEVTSSRVWPTTLHPAGISLRGANYLSFSVFCSLTLSSRA